MSAFEEVAAELRAVIDGDPLERMRVLTGNSIAILAALQVAAGKRPVWIQQPDGSYKEGWEPVYPGAWKPIATAPKGDEWVLIYSPTDGGQVYVATWCPDTRDGDFFRYGTREDYFGSLRGKIYNPTHWMPLPAAPHS